MDLPLDSILNALEDAVLCLSESMTVEWLNAAAAKLFGCEAESILGRPAGQLPLLAQVTPQLRLGELPRARATRITQTTRRVQLSRPGAEPAAFDARVSRLALSGQSIFIVVLRDVSLLVRMEQAVYESRQTQAVAALAGGIAHNFNNILTAVLSQIDLTLHAPEFPPALREHLIHAQTSARRGAELVARFETVGRQGQPEFAPTDLRAVVDQAVFLLRRSLDPQIEIEMPSPSAEIWWVRADAHQITQALLNLAINARDAMPQGGRLTFELTNETFTPTRAQPPRQPGEFVRLRVSDTGRGLPPEVASRAFEPYFTTEDRSRGPGLGLSIASAVVAEHAGWMELESRPGAGSCFSLFLPRSAEEARTRPPARLVDAKATEGTECLLIVDDEELVRLVTKAVLTYRGYKVLEAADGQEAVEIFTANQSAIGLILMDMHMPRLNGYDALLRIREIDPQAGAIMLSGGVHDPDASVADLPGVAFLHKPFENQELIRLVRGMLDARLSKARGGTK